MKRIIVLSLLLLSFASSAFAGVLATNTATAPGLAVYGGDSATNAGAATNPLVRLSTGVRGLVNFGATGTPAVVTSYALATKHDTGSKIFGTANDSTNIYWKQATAKIALQATGATVAALTDNANFDDTGWTAY